MPNWSLMDVHLTSPDSGIGPEWQDLARRALVPSGHNAPEILLPALRNHKRAVLATVRDSQGLQLALPLESRFLPLPHHASLSTPVSFFGLPHLGRYMAVPAVMALLRRLNRPVILHSVPVDGVLWETIAAASGHHAVIETWDRAALRPQGTYDKWFEENFDRKRRKEYRRLQSRLSEQGRLEALTLCPESDAARWADEFLTLEMQGWKGRQGTALKTDPAASAVLREGLAGLAAAGKLRFWKLALDGRPIAMMFAVVEERQAWLGKIAYDEDLARFSPGVQLIIHATEGLFADGVTLADSCAIPGHPMIDHLWRGRLRVADVMIAAPAVSGMIFNATLRAERLRRKLRVPARNLYYKLTGKHRS
ncbi:GNAT family N-acetyltransferase [Aestuariivirga sp.]|uniref:GNAT family N-acetyltransferase n=1 Tax=Aestuariivirga sp. TaxID=2650926 RepID=UPI0035930E6F